MAVFQLNISNKTSFCASISHPERKASKRLLIAIKISKNDEETRMSKIKKL